MLKESGEIKCEECEEIPKKRRKRKKKSKRPEQFHFRYNMKKNYTKRRGRKGRYGQGACAVGFYTLPGNESS
jgi:hypothetical protein